MDGEDDRINPRHRNWQRPNWKKFIFFCKSSDRGKADEVDSMPDRLTLSLAMTNIGDRVSIVGLNCGEANSHLIGMGLMPGTQLEVISRTGSGSAIVALQEQRIGVNAEMARHIQVAIAPIRDGDFQMSQSSTSSLKLRDAIVGSTLQVVGYEPAARAYKRKLLAMGLTPGTEFVVTRHAPLGDPTEIEVRGFHLSLRKDEADALRVEIAGSI
ncbi:FeoA family protein [Chroococcidiopsis thermalis]|uniref:FeoA family protein n=1 Tax=Chroococcidiopsis thermalis (strain PCC 7203) TaxID=251229 RepID=K9TUB4_CHRTP|nr:FeoA family protein [Chroococcidiopsis thermalis]AFY85594.1 FeoA family protein [Chroococcidiopsis thermalis PCC 7203]